MANKDLRGEVLRGATESLGTVGRGEETLLTETKVSHANVALISEQEVLWFQVSVHHSCIVEVLQCQYNLF